MRKMVITIALLAAGLAGMVCGQTTHYPVNADNAHEVGVKSSENLTCTLPFWGTGGTFGLARLGDEDDRQPWYAIFSFDMEAWTAGDTYTLFLSEASSMGDPFGKLGKVLIEYTDSAVRFPDRPGEVMAQVGAFNKTELYAAGGINIGASVNSILTGPHNRYLYLRFRFEQCTNGDAVDDLTQIVYDHAASPNTAIRIDQGAKVRTAYFAQFADGGTAPNNLASDILIVNLDPQKEATVTVRPKTSAGQPMAVDFNGQPASSQLEVKIPAGGMTSLKTDGQGDIQVGTVTLVSDANISAVVLFSGPVGFAGISASAPLQKIVIPVRTQAGGTSTGLAVMNLGVAQTLTVEIYSAAGVKLATAQLPLSAEGHDARFAEQYTWDAPVNFSDFKGTIVVTGTSEFAGVAILSLPGQFATVPVVEKGALIP